jgi:hypothetical protein
MHSSCVAGGSEVEDGGVVLTECLAKWIANDLPITRDSTT